MDSSKVSSSTSATSTTNSATMAVSDLGLTYTQDVACQADIEVGETSGLDCPICMEPPKDAVITRCGHLYCWLCLHQWANTAQHRACAVCWTGLDINNVSPVYQGASESREKPAGLPPRPTGTVQNRPVLPAAVGDSPLERERFHRRQFQLLIDVETELRSPRGGSNWPTLDEGLEAITAANPGLCMYLKEYQQDDWIPFFSPGVEMSFEEMRKSPVRSIIEANGHTVEIAFTKTMVTIWDVWSG